MSEFKLFYITKKMESLSQEEDDPSCIEDLCHSLQKSSQTLLLQFEETYQQFKLMRSKVKEQSVVLDTMGLKPRAHTRKWLHLHSLPETISFGEFFDVVLTRLAKENRLSLTGRTVKAPTDIAELFDVPEEVPLSIFHFLERAPLVFH